MYCNFRPDTETLQVQSLARLGADVIVLERNSTVSVGLKLKGAIPPWLSEFVGQSPHCPMLRCLWDFPTSAKIHCKCREVYLHSFISACLCTLFISMPNWNEVSRKPYSLVSVPSCGFSNWNPSLLQSNTCQMGHTHEQARKGTPTA